MKLNTAIPYYLKSIPQLLSIKPITSILKALLTNNPSQVKLDNMQFEVTGFTDIWAIKEVFINQDYEHLQQVQPNDIVIDIGAGIGDFSIKSSTKSNTTIYAYEADLHRFNVFKRNIKINRSNNITSTHQMVKSLDSIFADNKITHCDFLKIDCEGGEYQILLGSKQLKNVQHMAMEVHFFKPKHKLQYRQLVKQLKNQKFKVVEKPNQVHNTIAFLFATKHH